MVCPKCGSVLIKVYDVADFDNNGNNALRRKRACLKPKCKHRWKTIEVPYDSEEQIRGKKFTVSFS